MTANRDKVRLPDTNTDMQTETEICTGTERERERHGPGIDLVCNEFT